MNRNTLPQLARVVIIVALASAVISGAPTTVKQVHPPPAAGGNPPVVIAVLADHYAAGEEEEFDSDVENFFKYGLLVDNYFQNKAADLKIVSFFEATPAGQDSLYDFKIEPGLGNCAVVDAGDAVGKINTALGNTHPVHTVVLGNHPYNFGCTDASWTYVAVDAIGSDVLQHEFGHVLAELFDEWSLPGNKNVNYPKVIRMDDTRNCWPTVPPATMTPHWRRNPKFSDAKEYPECDLFGQQVVHPYEFCRMGTSHMHPPKFCKVCESEMDASFTYYRDWRRIVAATGRPQSSHTPTNTPRFRVMTAAFVEQPAPAPPAPQPTPPPAPAPAPILRLTVQIDPESGALTVKGRTSSTGVYVPSYRRLGQYVFEYLDGGKTVEVGVIPDHVFTARGYRGGAAHATSDRKPAQVVIDIPNEDVKTIQDPSRRLQLVLYRIPDTVTIPGRLITPLNFPTLRPQLTRVSQMEVK